MDTLQVAGCQLPPTFLSAAAKKKNAILDIDVSLAKLHKTLANQQESQEIPQNFRFSETTWKIENKNINKYLQ